MQHHHRRTLALTCITPQVQVTFKGWTFVPVISVMKYIRTFSATVTVIYVLAAFAVTPLTLAGKVQLTA